MYKALRNIKKKIFKLIAKYTPINRARVVSLRLAGYEVGEHVYIGEELHITEKFEHGLSKLHVGDRVAIAQRVLIVLDSDPNESRLREKVRNVEGWVRIEQDAWIGAGVIILPDVTIGEQSVVGAGSVVTKDVPAFSIVVGNPAHIIGEIEKNTVEELK